MVRWFWDEVRLEVNLLKKRTAVVVEARIQSALEPEHRLAAKVFETEPAFLGESMVGGQGNHKGFLKDCFYRQTLSVGVQADEGRVHDPILDVPNEADRMLTLRNDAPVRKALAQVVEHVGDCAAVEHGCVAHDKLPSIGTSCRLGRSNCLFRLKQRSSHFPPVSD